MRKIVKKYRVIAVIVIITILMQFQAFAANDSKTQGIETLEIINSNSRRGRLISSADAKISDEGKGIIGVYANMLCHEAMDELRIWIYLERQESTGSWVSVTHKQFDWVAEDYPNDDLTMAVVSYNVANMKRGEKYRLRCVFSAYSDELGSENWRAATGALYLE